SHDVVIANRVWNDGKRFAIHHHGERLVPADIVNVVNETQVLKNAQGVRRPAQPKRIEADRPGARNSLNRVDTRLIAGTFLFRSHGVLRLPRLSVSGGFMSACDNLLREFRVLLDCLTNHMGSYFDADAVPKVKEAWNPFLETIVVPFLCRQIGIFWVERRKGTARSSFGLCACFE